MTTSSIDITDSTRDLLQAMSRQTGRTIPEILEKAVEEYRRKIFFEGLDQDYTALKADPEAWAQELEERKLFENTLMDGLDADERWADNGKANN
ncbi:MAG TPA: hypothetical protein VGZ25_10790 [Gemmataceae bacterium]|jgi:hypothetical protein|nr:hypothetical protein [Gemmataceae bacterium]